MAVFVPLNLSRWLVNARKNALNSGKPTRGWTVTFIHARTTGKANYFTVHPSWQAPRKKNSQIATCTEVCG